MSDIPTEITAEMRQRLRELKVPHHQINELTPVQAWAKIQAGGAWDHPGWAQAAKDYRANRGADVNVVWLPGPPQSRAVGDYEDLPASFAEACRTADERIGPPEPIEPPQQAPVATIDALMHVLLGRGDRKGESRKVWVAARLAKLNEQQIRDVCVRLRRADPELWTQEKVVKLLLTWDANHGRR